MINMIINSPNKINNHSTPFFVDLQTKVKANFLYKSTY